MGIAERPLRKRKSGRAVARSCLPDNEVGADFQTSQTDGIRLRKGQGNGKRGSEKGAADRGKVQMEPR